MSSLKKRTAKQEAWNQSEANHAHLRALAESRRLPVEERERRRRVRRRKWNRIRRRTRQEAELKAMRPLPSLPRPDVSSPAAERAAELVDAELARRDRR